MGIQDKTVNNKTRVDIQVPIGGVWVESKGSTVEEQSVNDLLK